VHHCRDGWLLVGDVFWNESPPSEVREALGYGDEIADLAGTLARIEGAQLDAISDGACSSCGCNADLWSLYASRSISAN
jgi:hypothetical protein